MSDQETPVPRNAEPLPLRCMTPGCQVEFSMTPQRPVRGLCAKCYMAAVRLVNKGAVTWQDLELLHLSLPARRLGGGGKLGTFEQALLAAKRRRCDAITQEEERK